MKMIYQKDIKAYFNNMIGYVFLAIFLIVGGLFFSYQNIIEEAVKLNFYNLQYVLYFITPLLTMQLLAGEREAKTDQILFAAPVSAGSIVTGKFFAALTVFILAIGISFVYPFILSLFGAPAWSEIVLLYFGMLLFGAVLISIGLFVSSFSPSHIIAFYATLAIMICILFAQMMIPHIVNTVIRTILIRLTPSYHLKFFNTGILSIKSVVYFISLTFLFVFLASKITARRRWPV